MNTIRTLNLGAFPKKVLDFQESTVYLEQLTFIDYQLLLLLQNEFNGKTFIPASHFDAQGNGQPREKLDQLLGYVINVNANYNDEFKTVVELLYFNIIMAHLYYLGSNFEEMNHHLSLVLLTTLKPTASVLHNEFIEYLICRYHVIADYCPSNVSPLIEYLSNYKRPFKKSQVNANYWLDLLYSKLTLNLTNNGQTKLDFNDLKHLKFWNNPIALIGYAGYLLRTSSVSETSISGTFKADFSLHLANVLNLKIALKIDFPNSDDTEKDDLGLNGLKSGETPPDDVYASGALLNAFIYNLYETIHQIPFNYTVLKPALSKKFLINCTLKTYQSQTVLVNLIKALIELNKLDEAIAAFKTYKEYVLKDLEQNDGVFEDILTVVDIYAICLVNFNPLKAPNAFQTTSIDKVLVLLKTFSQELHGYLDTLKNLLELTYDEDEADETNTSVGWLSFLYKKYNVNVLLSDHSQCIELLSQAWFSLGYFHYFLAVHGSPTTALLESNKKKVLKYYKNGLIVNSTGNLVYLFNYALALSYEGHLKEALKLCKFILKKYPESFKTWNLMVLLTTSFETSENDDKSDKSDKSTAFESEKFINNALNIAGLFIAKHHQKDVKLTTEAKYEILQLKLTQMAVWESIHGVKYILEYLPEVFMLYHELFAIEFQRPKDVEQKTLIPMAHDSKWLHRPSVIDPTGGAGGELLPQRNGKSKETKRLSMRIKDKNHNHTLNNLKHLSLNTTNDRLDGSSFGNIVERKILQDVWLWTAKIYLRIGMLEESEQCIVEAETILEPNHKTFTMLGYLTSKTRKFLSLQEFERSLEALGNEPYNKVDYGNTLLGLCKLFLVDDELESSLFISEKDRESGLIRLKNMLERYALSWPHGSNSVEVWYYLSKIYESVDDKTLETTALWRCVELEDYRPVRGFDSSDNYSY